MNITYIIVIFLVIIVTSFILAAIIFDYTNNDNYYIQLKKQGIKDKINLKGCIIAVDFDNTLAITKYPEIIKPIDSVCNVIRKTKENGATIVLWTCREGNELEAALDWCKENDVPIDYVNENIPERVLRYHNDSRKICADIYIDDKSINPRLKWLQ